MRLIRPAYSRRVTGPMVLAPLMLIVGCAAAVVMAVLPKGSNAPIGLLGLSATLGLGIGGALAVRALGAARRLTQQRGDDLALMLTPAFDDAYVLILSPRLPGVPDDLAGLLIGPAGVRVLVARRWHGRYRVRNRSWEFDTRSRAAWIPCATNPSFDVDKVTAAVSHWAREAADGASLPFVGAIAFPRRYSKVVLEDPDADVVTLDNAPWWAQRIGRIQRMDPPRVARFVEAVLGASERPADGRIGATSPRIA
jgi:hypothetical protein